MLSLLSFFGGDLTDMTSNASSIGLQSSALVGNRHHLSVA